MGSLDISVMYQLTWIVLTLGLPALLTLLVNSLVASEPLRMTIKDRKKPLTPYWVPVLGHGLSFFWNTAIVGEFSKKAQQGVVCLQLFTTKINFVNGSENIMTVWRSKDLDAQAVTMFSLKEFFNTPAQSMKAYLRDTSGINPHPHPKSNVATNDRYYFQNRKHIVGFFNGPGLRNMGSRFAALLTQEISQVSLEDGWTMHEDLYAFIQNLLIRPAVEAMCGPVLFEQNPGFGMNFWEIDSDIFYFFKAYPRWLVPRAYANRNKLLRSVKQWHEFARAGFDESCIESDGHDRFYGSPLMRSRQDYLSKVEHLDADAIASQDLGLLWAENANSIPAVFWMMYEALQRPTLLVQALDDIAASRSLSLLLGNPSVDVETLCRVPILQSMYAETLRLYTSLFSLRSAIHGNFELGNHTIPQGELIAVDSRVSAMDKRVWNTGAIDDEEEPHPLDQWWAERFLVNPNDPNSGPVRPQASKARAPADVSPSCLGHDYRRFTTEGLAGAWTPYGGGPRQCPGRNFAKQEIIVAFVLIFSTLEIELLDAKCKGPVEPNLKYYGLGTLPPKGNVPFRMRKRG